MTQGTINRLREYGIILAQVSAHNAQDFCIYHGFSCITVTTVLQENLLCEPHAVRGRVSCIMGAPDHNARNSIRERRRQHRRRALLSAGGQAASGCYSAKQRFAAKHELPADQRHQRRAAVPPAVPARPCAVRGAAGDGGLKEGGDATAGGAEPDARGIAAERQEGVCWGEREALSRHYDL